MDEKIKEVLDKYFLERTEHLDLDGYKVIGTKSIENKARNIIIYCKTKDNSWPCEFNIVFIPMAGVDDLYNSSLGKMNILVLVSEDCPAGYFIENEEFLEVADKLYNLSELTDVTVRVTPNSITDLYWSNNNYYVGNPGYGYWTTGVEKYDDYSYATSTTTSTGTVFKKYIDGL